MPAARRRIVVSSQERLGGTAAAFTVRTPAFQNGSGFQGQPRVRFALEWCTPVSGFQGIAPAPLSLLLCSPSVQQSNTWKSWAPADNDAVLALLQSRGGDNVYGEMADSPYVQSSACAGLCDGSRLVRGDMSFYLLQGPTVTRRSVQRWEPDVVTDFSFSLVFWVDEPERPLASHPPFFHVWLLSRGGSDRVPVDFRTFRTDREEGEGARWQVAVSHCSLVRLVGAASSYGVAVTSTTFVDDPFQQLSVLAYLPGTESAGGAVFAGQKLSLKGVHEDTVGLPLRRPLDWAGEVDLQLRTAAGGFAPVPDAASAYIICLTFFKIPP